MFKTTPHIYLPYSKKTLNWLPIDSEEEYNKNLTDKLDDLKKYNWIDKTFEYKFNSYGFRSDEFSLDPNMIFLGCSHTVGIGLPLENTFSHLVSKQLRLKNFNLSNGGGSNDLAFRLAHNWIPQLKPKIVILFSPDETRSETVDIDNEIRQFGVWNEFTTLNSYWGSWMSNDINAKHNKIKNQLAIKQICSGLDIKFEVIETSKMLEYNSELSIVDFARDLSHPGIQTNKNIAEHILSLL